MATLVSGGDHYETHLLKNAKSYDNPPWSMLHQDHAESRIGHQRQHPGRREGGHAQPGEGSLELLFNKCIVPVGCKTGTAETYSQLANGRFCGSPPMIGPQTGL